MLEKSQAIRNFLLFTVLGIVGAMFVPFGWRWASKIKKSPRYKRGL